MNIKHETLTGCALLGLVAGVMVGCGSETRQTERLDVASEPAFIQGERVVLTIHGMSCPLCASNVDGALMDVPGVRSVALDMSTGEATLALDPSVAVSHQQLKDAVDRSGFSLVRIAAH